MKFRDYIIEGVSKFIKEEETAEEKIELLLNYIKMLKDKVDEYKTSYNETEFDNELLQEKVKKLEQENERLKKALESCRNAPN